MKKTQNTISKKVLNIEGFHKEIIRDEYVISINAPISKLNQKSEINITIRTQGKYQFDQSYPGMMMINPKHKGEVDYQLNINSDDGQVDETGQIIKFKISYFILKTGNFKTILDVKFVLLNDSPSKKSNKINEKNEKLEVILVGQE